MDQGHELFNERLSSVYDWLNRYQYIIFNFAVLLTIIIFYIETRRLRNEASASFPKLMLAIAFFMWILVTIQVVASENIKDRIGLDIDDDLIDQDLTLEANLPKSTIAFGWIIAYWLAMNHIGFFTAAFAFTLIYSYLNMEQGAIRNFVYSFTLATGLTVLMYIFLIEAIAARFLLRLGFLP